MYSDEASYHKGETQKKKIVEVLKISVDEDISIISKVVSVLSKKDPDVTRQENSNDGNTNVDQIMAL